MLLGDLVPGLPGLDDKGSQIAVTGLAIDNRQIKPGYIFGAFVGAQVNAEKFIGQAVENGAVAVVCRPEASVQGAVHISDDNPRRAFAQIAGRYFGPYPATVAAITGTNGKTSVAEMLRQIWAQSGLRSASLGTLGITTGGAAVRDLKTGETGTQGTDAAETRALIGLTTPDIVTFLSRLSGLAKDGVDHLVFEASSHGLSQHRSEGMPIHIAGFTNLSRDHLDYHGDMDAYFNDKMRLFDTLLSDDGTAVIWSDDEWSAATIERAKSRGLKLMTVGETGRDICLLSRKSVPSGQVLTVRVGQETQEILLPLIGAYQSANALVAAAMAMASGMTWADVSGCLTHLEPVRGRLEKAAVNAHGAAIYVDYAHTPDGLTAALHALRPHVTGRLICVFGAGGDRDAGKRPLMGRAVCEGADIAVVTDDNPRGEDAASIRRAVLQDCPGAVQIADRAEAIGHALALAGPEDIVLIAGKGHEQGQIIGGEVLPFDDAATARAIAEGALA